MAYNFEQYDDENLLIVIVDRFVTFSM